MQKKTILSYFLVDDRAVSEEFTSLPGLSVVMIGFSIFLVLLAHTYTAYENRLVTLSRYQIADNIATTLVKPDCYFMRSSGIVDISLLNNDTEKLIHIQELYKKSDITFIIRITGEGANHFSMDFPSSTLVNVNDRVAASRKVGVYLNEACTYPGTLTVIVWREYR